MRMRRNTGALATNPNMFQLVAFDPGGTIGWAHFTVHFRAFSRPENKVLRYVESWDCGEFSGTEREQIRDAIGLCYRARFEPLPYTSKMDVVTEDFDLVQTIGGKELVSPLRINAVLDYELITQCGGLQLHYQKRQARTQITPERLRAFGFEGRWGTSGRGKDSFAAMQHAVTWLRRLKAEADRRPWKLESDSHTNAYWDCSCSRGSKRRMSHIHDLVHPQ